MLFKLLEKDDDEINRNLSYCLGILIEYGSEYVKDYIMKFLSTLKSIFYGSKQ